MFREIFSLALDSSDLEFQVRRTLALLEKSYDCFFLLLSSVTELWWFSMGCSVVTRSLLDINPPSNWCPILLWGAWVRLGILGIGGCSRPWLWFLYYDDTLLVDVPPYSGILLERTFEDSDSGWVVVDSASGLKSGCAYTWRWDEIICECVVQVSLLSHMLDMLRLSLTVI